MEGEGSIIEKVVPDGGLGGGLPGWLTGSGAIPWDWPRDIFGLLWLALSGKREQNLGSSRATPICIFRLKEGSLSG